MNQGEFPFLSATGPGCTRGARPPLIGYDQPS